MRKAIFLCIFLCIFTIISAQDLNPPDTLFIGFGPELNVQTRDGVAHGGGVFFGYEYNSRNITGIKLSYFNDLYTVHSLEILYFFRSYIPALMWPENSNGMFLQGEGGVIVFWEHGKAYPVGSLGILFGWHFNNLITPEWFVEPAIRFGFPHAWGLSVCFGYTFPVSAKQNGGINE